MQSMEDYRFRPLESPLAWSQAEKQLRPSSEAHRIMTTVYHITADGIYPYGIFPDESTKEKRTKDLSRK
ncbi:hypothetical protein J2S03_003044 [Alicyclobacillus cycloheptanicus]|uniref:Uncharacterized protein n=1 Tax=Alicyclobacillus cycloheptanicus TaxID=1457 RepID=A0ABT9XLK6_9BACL|nr:hypothetical protein [Alicyclobacillus cycloheptanicus]